MAQFSPANTIVKKSEGGYANVPGDGGGITYAGITQNFNPEWTGWPIVFAYQKKLGRELKNNEKVPGIDSYVDAFYQAWFNKLLLTQIKSQDVANIIFDFIVNSASTGVLETEQVLQNVLKANIKADRTWDQASIDVVNAQDPVKLFKAILDERDSFYNVIAKKLKNYTVVAGDTVATITKKFSLPASEMPYTSVAPGQVLQLRTQLQFLKGWLKRLDVFRGVTPAQIGGGIGGILLLAGLFFLVRKKLKAQRKRRELNGKPKRKSKGR